MKPICNALILDMDGLLLDTEPVYKKAWQYGGNQLGFSLSDALCNEFSGNSLAAIKQRLIQTFGQQFDFSSFLKISSDYWYQCISTDGVQPMPGALLLLEILQDQQVDFALATNSPAHIATHCLHHAGLEHHVSIRATSDEVTQTKPAPDIYHLAMQKLNRPAQQCLCVEDSLPGIQSAHQAGGITAIVSTPETQQSVSHLADFQFSSLHELVDCLSQILS